MTARPPCGRAEHGAAGLATTGTALLLMAVLLSTALPLLHAVVTAHRVAGAADLVALAVLSGSPLAGGDGEPAIRTARRVARANDVELVDVDVAGWPLGVHVEVRAPVVHGLRQASATSTATLRRP